MPLLNTTRWRESDDEDDLDSILKSIKCPTLHTRSSPSGSTKKADEPASHCRPCNKHGGGGGGGGGGGSCVPCSELARVEDQMQTLQSRLRALRKERLTAASNWNASHRCLITRLPYEIASDVVLRVCLDAVRPRCAMVPQAPKVPGALRPSSLAAVCRAWRALVRSIPELRSSISIGSFSSDLPRIDRLLQKSPTTGPLSLQLDLTSRRDEAVEVIALVRAHLHRATYLCISMPSHLFSVFTSVIGSGAAPLLEELHVHDVISDPPCPDAYFKLCDDLPRLRRVSTSGYPVDKIHLDWTHVSQLTIILQRVDRSIVDEFLDCLSMARSLVELNFDGGLELFPMPIPESGRTIVQNSIRKLRLHSHRAASLIFSHTRLPSLASLAVKHLDLLLDTFRELSGFLQRSASLTSLELSFAKWDGPGGHMSFLKQLSLADGASQDELAADHDPISGNVVFLPLLQELKYTVRQPVHLPLGIFLDIMENRHAISLAENSQVFALQRLSVQMTYHSVVRSAKWPGAEPDEGPNVTEHDLQRIFKLRAMGKMVSVLRYLDKKGFDLVEGKEISDSPS